MHMVEKILNNTTPYGKIRASREGSLHSSTLSKLRSNLRKVKNVFNKPLLYKSQIKGTAIDFEINRY